MADLPKHSVSVSGIVTDADNRVLVIRRADNGRWEAPGGVLELGESLEDGVRREVAEETGIRVRVDRLTGAYKNLAGGIVALVFRCTAQEGAAHPTDEAHEVRWMTPAEIRAAMVPAFAIRVLDALEEGQPRVRSHDGINLMDSDPGRLESTTQGKKLP
ncbi:NUDIX hydrolase [Nocardia amamiensis]|uniref:NUDIX hydrolase n=1 Tax=Nocardia amamiensis TaxID=404578 RepID=UPI00082FB3A8|nr:NUDIX hydrolase [Nocardia amamiensis]